ncbi:uncharacterized protein N7483_008578 [Penicillium malachiteum]|uniref:uncharacterized protein n=1 Tax=Penicillium malachiteum TaxID=1324776 RepID=UPI002547CD0C|nr:uncharacterized protein N7483_008578 [Penicillium malachiteum]KAJ5720644.1 hypothetical protein N7483_008578 [Penicillium malachiteum]
MLEVSIPAQAIDSMQPGTYLMGSTAEHYPIRTMATVAEDIVLSFTSSTCLQNLRSPHCFAPSGALAISPFRQS